MPSELPARFTPVRRASTARVLLFTLGPLLWLAAIVLVWLVAHRSDAVELGLGVTAAASVVLLAVCGFARHRRRREEEADEP
jgi:hypothetical protein